MRRSNKFKRVIRTSGSLNFLELAAMKKIWRARDREREGVSRIQLIIPGLKQRDHISSGFPSNLHGIYIYRYRCATHTHTHTVSARAVKRVFTYWRVRELAQSYIYLVAVMHASKNLYLETLHGDKVRGISKLLLCCWTILQSDLLIEARSRCEFCAQDTLQQRTIIYTVSRVIMSEC